jgi:hypothetical protein
MKKIGYARVSSLDQNLDCQIAALRGEGCDKIFREKASGKDLRNRFEPRSYGSRSEGIVRIAQSKGRKDRNLMLSPGARSPAAMVEGASAVLGRG